MPQIYGCNQGGASTFDDLGKIDQSLQKTLFSRIQKKFNLF